MEPYPPRGALALKANPSESAIGWWICGFPHLAGGVDPGDLRFRPQVVGVVEVWKDF